MLRTWLLGFRLLCVLSVFLRKYPSLSTVDIVQNCAIFLLQVIPGRIRYAISSRADKTK